MEKVYEEPHWEGKEETNCKIWCWNVNGVRAVLRNGSFESLMRKERPKIFCLNETKVCEDRLYKDKVRPNIAKWFPTQYWNCCKPPIKGYAGTAILINKEFEGGKPIKVEFDFGKKGLHD